MENKENDKSGVNYHTIPSPLFPTPHLFFFLTNECLSQCESLHLLLFHVSFLNCSSDHFITRIYSKAASRGMIKGTEKKL